MPDQLTTNSFSGHRRAGAWRVSLLTCALCGLALTAAAQTPAPSPGRAASRARRAKAPGVSKQSAPASKEESGAKVAPSLEGAATEGNATAAGAAVEAEAARPAESVLTSKGAAEEGSTAEKNDALKDSKGATDEAAAVVSSPPADEAAEIEGLRARAESGVDASERGRLRRTLAERLAAAGRRAEAVELLRAMLAEERFDPQHFYNTGNALARLGESGAAIEAYRKAAAQRRGNYARAQHNLGVVLLRLGRWEEAQEALTTALRLEHYAYAEASYNLGRLHALRGEAGLAIGEWARTLKIKPDHADAAVALARTLAADGDPEEALAVLDAFDARLKLRGAVASREIAVARGEIVAANNVAAHNVSTVEKASGVASSEKRPPSSSSYKPARASKAAALRPLSVNRESYALLRRARAARDAKRAEESVALYRRVIEGSGGYFPPANLELGFALASLGHHEEAVTSILNVTRKDGERYPISFYHLGRYYEHLGRLDEAGEAFGRAVTLLGTESPQFLLDVSRVREKQGKWAEALSATEAYVRAAERMGAVPDWAHERIERLRQKAATGGDKNQAEARP